MDISTTHAYAQLRMYLARGWALVPLHHAGPGGCSCKLGRECRSAGKHPRIAEWQRPEHLVRDEATLARWAPETNWGLATGVISGVWALDYDPKSVVPGTEPEVQGVLEACWASATWVQRTGSGGLHFVFALPADFVPNNGTGRLPKGFDVRGARRGESGGGQIVLAPSVSGTGPYEVLADRPPQLAPALVTEAVRPAPPRAPIPHDMYSMTTLATSDQVAKYVTSAINGELAALRGCWTSRNQRAWTAAARCIEMINTGAVAGDAVYAAWWAAGLAHPDVSVTVPEAELLRVWASAERHVGDRPADLSGVGGPAGWLGDAIFPTGAPPAPPLGGGWDGAGAGVTGRYPQAVHAPGDNGASASGQPPLDPVDALIARMLTPEQLDERPNPQPLINGVLDLSTTAWLIGKSGSCKSFVALDMAAHVGLGLDWRGHKVTQGLVIYIVAEGDQGMKLRQAAWRREHGRPMKDVLFLAEPVQADERRTPDAGAWSVLVAACRRLRPVLVIVDTQARVTLGLKENDNGDMSYYAAQADRIKRATGACVLTVHHLGRTGGDARGASALDGAQDAELKVERTGMQLKLIMDKQKDQAEAEPMTIPLRRSEGGTDPVTGRDLSSLVLDGMAVPLLAEAGLAVPLWRTRALVLFRIMHGLLGKGGDGATRDAISKLFKAEPEIASLSRSMQNTVFHESWVELVRRGRVMKFGTKERFAAFPPPDGAAEGMLTINSDGPDEAPPDGWVLYWPPSDRDKAIEVRDAGNDRRLFG